MFTSDFDFDLPEELIATHPASPRDHSKLMVVDRSSQTIEHAYFYELQKWIQPNDLLVLNNSKVIPARLFSQQGKIELLLLEETSPNHWLAIGKPSKKLTRGSIHHLDTPHLKEPGPKFEVLRTLEDGSR
ncbi:MAG: S-adenosylmethionine:tRNA ribosyltransferase-isomerase, partial [Verrucomicrobiota bacterium]